MLSIVCFGDSITHAHGLPERDRWPTILQRRLDDWRPDWYAVYNRGIGGHTTAEALERFRGDVLDLRPGLVVIQFGFNDANAREFQPKPRVGIEEYAANLAGMGRRIRAEGGEPVYVVNHRPVGACARQGDGRSYHRRMDAYNARVRRVARALDARCVDVPAGLRRRRLPASVFLADAVHLSAAGNRVYADLVLEVVRPLLERRPEPGPDP